MKLPNATPNQQMQPAVVSLPRKDGGGVVLLVASLKS
ncbi:hypothetical protein FAM18168_02860 [Lacticaseibacillus paracasei]|nr:hypothetical protein FAM18110_02912 [Lacticaseibacillus paracasei]RND75307.1 hypothetical protein FAM18149_03025 [Lacticaseibacillus paracasei]RND80191.1 hypothetical protein FAM18168_02860 [Lacticaseibacillus paracasei]RNE34437.1 hypothetical protein FAM6410_02097 [Lacticaseibacillus paracasei]VTZ97636.1 hypothetical protein LRHP540_02743 [Lacticaseibacillus rhamnosus]